MIPELGNVALILALCLALVQSTLPIAGAILRVPFWVALARPAARGQFLFIAIAFGALITSLIRARSARSRSARPLVAGTSASAGGRGCSSR